MVILDVRISEQFGIKVAKRFVAAATKEVLRRTAIDFHDHILPSHFGPANRRKYNHEIRNRVYANEIKKRFGTGQGKYVDNVLAGRSKRRAMAFPSVRATQHRARLTVQVPAYFTKPFIGTFRDPENGYTRRVTRQPDKVAELKHIPDDEKELLRKMANQHAQDLINDELRSRAVAQRVVRG